MNKHFINLFIVNSLKCMRECHFIPFKHQWEGKKRETSFKHIDLIKWRRSVCLTRFNEWPNKWNTKDIENSNKYANKLQYWHIKSFSFMAKHMHTHSLNIPISMRWHSFFIGWHNFPLRSHHPQQMSQQTCFNLHCTYNKFQIAN